MADNHHVPRCVRSAACSATLAAAAATASVAATVAATTAEAIESATCTATATFTAAATASGAATCACSTATSPRDGANAHTGTSRQRRQRGFRWDSRDCCRMRCEQAQAPEVRHCENTRVGRSCRSVNSQACWEAVGQGLSAQHNEALRQVCFDRLSGCEPDRSAHLKEG